MAHPLYTHTRWNSYKGIYPNEALHVSVRAHAPMYERKRENPETDSHFSPKRCISLYSIYLSSVYKSTLLAKKLNHKAMFIGRPIQGNFNRTCTNMFPQFLASGKKISHLHNSEKCVRFLFGYRSCRPARQWGRRRVSKTTEGISIKLRTGSLQ
jgi:hypothetical protein